MKDDPMAIPSMHILGRHLTCLANADSNMNHTECLYSFMPGTLPQTPSSMQTDSVTLKATAFREIKLTFFLYVHLTYVENNIHLGLPFAKNSCFLLLQLHNIHFFPKEINDFK